MDAQDFRSLQEAYMEVVENQQLDEARGDEGLTPLQKIRLRNRRDPGIENIPAGRKTSFRRDMNKLHRGYSKRKMGLSARQMNPKPNDDMREQVDLYDIILSHLLDEGYAETIESAEAIMVNMSEEWRDEIVEEMLDEANKAEKMLGLTPRQREQARNLHQYTGKPIFYGTNPNRRKKPDRSDPILNKSHKDMTAKRQASHKAGRHLRGDTGESGNVVRSRYQANKDHKDGYPSIRRVDT